MPAGVVTDAVSLALVPEPVPADQTVAGSPTTALHELDASTGVWEMSPGVMSDVEADELFVVLTGDATVEFVHPALPSIRLSPGSVVRLEAGMRTVWTVRETLRKVYIAF
ncbi:hypothetical protein SAMN04487846_0874 [Microbacterium sp. cf046]|nr:hypothetical protein SAMN04487846_0874 [Microbacterium sp. cf046]